MPYIFRGMNCLCKRRKAKSDSVEDEYDIKHAIGYGKTGYVYHGVNKYTRQVVAIKRINNDYLSTASRKDALKIELKILSRMNHAAIGKCFGVYKSASSVDIVLEMYTGGTVFERLHGAKNGEIGEMEVCKIIKDISSALVYLHSRGIAHRDIKPDNVIFASKEVDSDVKLIDFGVAVIGRVGRREMKGMAGTGHFMAPEVFASIEHTYGTEVDIWALGILTYLLLFGKYPFDAPFLSQLEDQIKSGDFEILDWMNALVSENAIHFIRRLLVLDPQKRPLAIEIIEHPWFRKGGAKPGPFCDEHANRLRALMSDKQETKAQILEQKSPEK